MPEMALRRLREPQNRNLDWLLGDLLRQRAARDDWHYCPILQQLERQNQEAERIWETLIGTCRALLADDAEAPRRAIACLQPADKNFDSKLDDFVAELIAIDQMGRDGACQIRLLDAGDNPTPDFQATRNGETLYIEVKNLRAPDSIEAVALRRWYTTRTKHPDQFQFDVVMKYGADLDLLDQEQITALEHFIDSLHGTKPHADIRRQLPGGDDVSFTIVDGKGQMVVFGGTGCVIDENYLVDGAQQLVTKVMGQICKALSQLYGSQLPETATKILFLRWKVPDTYAAAPDEIRDRVQAELQLFLNRFFPRLEVRIAHNYEP